MTEKAFNKIADGLREAINENDLVKQLRAFPMLEGSKLCREAADRIDALEAALHEAYRHIDECCPHRIPNDARAALGEKKDG